MSALKAVFGHDVELDEHGKPIEKGKGALKRVEEAVAKAVDPEVFAERDAAVEEVRQLNADLMAVIQERDDALAEVVKLTGHVHELTKQVEAATPDKSLAETAEL